MVRGLDIVTPSQIADAGMNQPKSGDPTTLNRLYGRSIGKHLRSGQQRLLAEFLPQVAVPDTGAITTRRLFGDERPLHFEIGFGGGEHLAERADALPDHGFIGAEPFVNGMAQALGHLEQRALTNARIHHGDALQVLRRIPDGTLAIIYLLHPDPWPKARHAKRRMMNDGPLALFARKLASGGELRFGTDHPVYLRHALMVMRRFADSFEWLVNGPPCWQVRPSDWPQTRYEAKARMNGQEIWYFRFRRR